MRCMYCVHKTIPGDEVSSYSGRKTLLCVARTVSRFLQLPHHFGFSPRGKRSRPSLRPVLQAPEATPWHGQPLRLWLHRTLPDCLLPHQPSTWTSFPEKEPRCNSGSTWRCTVSPKAITRLAGISAPLPAPHDSAVGHPMHGRMFAASLASTCPMSGAGIPSP